MAEDKATLSVFYQGWHDYQQLLIKALAPLSTEQLALRAAPRLRSISDIVLHIIGARARWFHDLMEVGDEDFARMAEWDRKGAPTRDAAELVYGLETTWRVMQEALARWTPQDLQFSYPGEPGEGDPETFTRQWVIWHLIEHDLHHGGEVSLTLGIHGLEAPAL
ncbi:MAG: DinB family protein [Ktedonobacteraceae bacterium]